VGGGGDGYYTTGSTLRWGCEFASPYDSTGRKHGSNSSAHVPDFNLTYMLPSPRQLELVRLPLR